MLSFVTVVYDDDLPLLELQARSFSKWIRAELVGEILIALNDCDLGALRRKVEALIPLYGKHSLKVKVFNPKSLLLQDNVKNLLTRIRLLSPLLSGKRPRRGGWRGHPGWLTQQALKLSFGREVRFEKVIILDAKNVWLKSVELSDFYATDGRCKCQFIDGAHGRNQRAWLPPSFATIGIECDLENIRKTTHFLTPFPITKAILAGSLYLIEENFDSVAAAFIFSDPSPTEFFIINAFVMKVFGNLDAIFVDGLDVCTPIAAAMKSSEIDEALVETQSNGRKMIALHASAWKRFSVDQNMRLFHILRDAELVWSPEQLDRLMGKTAHPLR